MTKQIYDKENFRVLITGIVWAAITLLLVWISHFMVNARVLEDSGQNLYGALIASVFQQGDVLAWSLFAFIIAWFARGWERKSYGIDVTTMTETEKLRVAYMLLADCPERQEVVPSVSRSSSPEPNSKP